MKTIILVFSLIFSFTLIAQDKIAFEEYFDNNDKEWYIIDDENCRFAVEDGHYIVRHKRTTGSWSSWNGVRFDANHNYEVECKLKLTDGVDNYGYGIFFKDQRWSENEKYHYFIISGNKQYKLSVWNKEKDETTAYKDWTEDDCVNSFNEYNILRIKRKDDVTRFYINDVEIYSQDDLYFGGSLLGFIAYNDLEFQVDHIKIFQDREINLAEEDENIETDIVKENLGSNINTQYSEIMPVITADGQTLYLDVKNDPANTGGDDNDDIWYSVLDENGNWGKRQNIGKPINNISHNFVISATPDNNKLILYSQYTKKGDWKADGISYSTRTKKGWSVPKDIFINNFYNDNQYVSFAMSPDQKVLVASLERNDTYGGQDLYVCFLKNYGTWTEPLNMGKIINSFSDESTPFVAADGKTMYYCSEGKPGYGSGDIFISKRLDDTWTNWTEPVNLGKGINTEDWDAYYTIPAKGDYAYLVSASQREGDDSNDIYRVKVSKRIKPDPVVLIYGNVFNSKTKEPLEASITYFDLKLNEEVGIANSSPADGAYKIILPAGRSYGFLAEKKGFISVSENLIADSIADYMEIKRDLYLTPIEVGQTVRLNNIFFEFNKADLLPESNAELERLVKLMNDNKKLEIEIGGHTDNVGSDQYNLDLSEKRVQSVLSYLKEKGITERVSGKGYGETKPVATNDTEEGRQLNRRVEFVILKK